MRAVIDTNVLVSRTLSPGGTPGKIFTRWSDGAFELVVSESLLAEYKKALNYERVRKIHKYAPERIEDVVETIRAAAIEVKVTEFLHVVMQDPDDNKILECAAAANADYIVSGDRHLLALGDYNNIPILSPAAFLSILDHKDV